MTYREELIEKYPFISNYSKTPYPYQIEAMLAGVKSLKAKERGLINAGVGAGKTLIFSLIADLLEENLLIIAHNKELIQQNYEEAIESGIKDCSIYCAGLKQKDVSGRVVFSTVKSAKAKPDSFKKFNYIIVDEADYQYNASPKSEYRKFFTEIKAKGILGFTGTSFTTHRTLAGTKIKLLFNGKPRSFDKLVYNVPLKEVLELGVWSKLKYHVYPYDSTNLKVNTGGENYTETSIRECNVENGVNNNGYSLIKKLLNQGEKGILCYCESLDIAEIFVKKIPNSAMLSHKTKSKDREKIIKDFKEGRLDVIFNLSILQAGFNMKTLSKIIVLRPLNLRAWIQVCGRGVRTHKNKTHCDIFDFCGNIKYGEIENIDLMKVGGDWRLVSGKGNEFNILSGIDMRMIGKVTCDSNGNLLKTSKATNNSLSNYKMPWGKYSGKPLNKIPTHYLEYISKQNYAPQEVLDYFFIK